MTHFNPQLLRTLKNNDIQINLNNLNKNSENYFIFLQKNNCLNEYIEERKKYLEHKVWLKNSPFFVHLLSSFTWLATKQGEKFWNDLSKKYQIYAYTYSH